MDCTQNPPAEKLAADIRAIEDESKRLAEQHRLSQNELQQRYSRLQARLRVEILKPHIGKPVRITGGCFGDWQPLLGRVVTLVKVNRTKALVDGDGFTLGRFSRFWFATHDLEPVAVAEGVSA